MLSGSSKFINNYLSIFWPRCDKQTGWPECAAGRWGWQMRSQLAGARALPLCRARITFATFYKVKKKTKAPLCFYFFSLLGWCDWFVWFRDDSLMHRVGVLTVMFEFALLQRTFYENSQQFLIKLAYTSRTYVLYLCR